jgi:Zn-dependent protease
MSSNSSMSSCSNLSRISRLKVPFRMHSTGWFSLALCVFLGFAIAGSWLGLPLGALLLASLLMHEVGHMLAATLFGVQVHEFGLRMGGAYTRRAYATTRRDEVLISAAGPLMNLCLALPLFFLPHIGAHLALGNLALCVINLLPLPSSDGLHILRTMRSAHAPGVMIPVLSQNHTE